MSLSDFSGRHLGSNADQIKDMCQEIGVQSIQELIDKTIPANIRLKAPLDVTEALSEYEYAQHIQEIASKNKVFKTYIGLGYHNTITPNVIKRNILENPGWYTAYTPYQAEISQGRLECLLNFQTVISDFTGLSIANASLLDESTAAAEGMSMLFHARSKAQEDRNANKFFVASHCFPQNIAVLQTHATPLGIELVIADYTENPLDDSYFGALIQYPDATGEVHDFKNWVSALHAKEIKVVVAADLMSLALLTPPGEWGADVVVGNSQRFGVPMGFGGPHAAFFATHEEFKRLLPGRIIGVSQDRRGNSALRMALQTREQHIRRDKATSNICTAQALLAIMASMYAVYHGPKGVKEIAETIHEKTGKLSAALKMLGVNIINKYAFDTLSVAASEELIKGLKTAAEGKQINFGYEKNYIRISINETTSWADIQGILDVFSMALNKTTKVDAADSLLPNGLKRTTSYLTHKIFNSYHTETELMRYIKRLENKDISLTRSMISLGSCTMKLNAASELYPIGMAAFANIHPFVPVDQMQGYKIIFDSLENWLSKITGFAGVSLQPNSGAQGEYTGLMVIRAYHLSRGDVHRNIALIPSSAHGTNPASAVVAGMQVVVVNCDELGNIDVSDLKLKAEKYKDSLSCLMVTYPSTHGVFEESIIDITNIIHQYGGQVYMDGANMNAQVGLTSPGNIGADVCHLNLHKTFAIPHGGGGPGVGPIGVAKHLVPFLPSHPVIKTGGDQAISAVSAAPWGSALILLISYAYIKMLGSEGITEATKTAIFNANYMKNKIEKHYPILYQGKNKTVAHEMIVDCREFKRATGVEAGDIAKRLMDYGFHAPTVSFPVAGTLMIEPTESESREELDRFCQAMISIRKEIKEIEEGKFTPQDNVVKNAPHTALEVTGNDWNHAYTRAKAAYPLHWIEENKYWPPVALIDNAFGDRNLICTCPSIEEYQMEEA